MVFMTFSEKDPDFIKANKTWTLVTPCLFCLEMLKLCECSQRQCQAWGPRLVVMRHVFPERTHLLMCFFYPSGRESPLCENPPGAGKSCISLALFLWCPLGESPSPFRIRSEL